MKNWKFKKLIPFFTLLSTYLDTASEENNLKSRVQQAE